MKLAACNPSLWREIITVPQNNETINDKLVVERNSVFSRCIARSTQLRVLSLKYSLSIDERVTELIGQNACSFHLRELYLDGCERVDDVALLKLTKPRKFDDQEDKGGSTEFSLLSYFAVTTDFS